MDFHGFSKFILASRGRVRYFSSWFRGQVALQLAGRAFGPLGSQPEGRRATAVPLLKIMGQCGEKHGKSSMIVGYCHYRFVHGKILDVGYGKILDDCHYVQSKLTLQEANMAGKSPKKRRFVHGKIHGTNGE